MQTFMTRKDDNVGSGRFDSIEWLFEVHVKMPDTKIFNSAVLYGNEDAPAKVEFFRAPNPNWDAVPDLTWTPNEA